MKSVYVVYKINAENNDCEIHVFAEYCDAKWYRESHGKENYCIWQRPIE